MQINLSNKTALITGASQGIGKEIARQLAQAGAKVIVTARNIKKLAEAVKDIESAGSEVYAYAADAAKENELLHLAEKINHDIGDVDILVNNVAEFSGVARVEEFEANVWQRMFHLNVMSGVTLSKALMPTMKANKWGRIIFIASERGTEPKSHVAPYAMSKAAMLSVAKSLANELGRDAITVNCISPGVILTPSWDAAANAAAMSRDAYAQQFSDHVLASDLPGLPEDVASLACYLCSQQARWVTGSNFRVDGGSTKSMQI